MSEEEIRKFMQKYYPEYADNLKLGKILYERFMKKRRVKSGSKYRDVSIAEARELGSGVRVRLKGVVDELYTYQYEGCAVCKRKRCNNPNHKGKKTWVVYGFKLIDEGGDEMWVSFIDDVIDVDNGDVVVVEGRTKMYRGDLELAGDNVEVVRKVFNGERGSRDGAGGGSQKDEVKGSSFVKKPDDERVAKVLEAIRLSGSLNYAVFKSLLARLGLNEKDVDEWVEIRSEKGKKKVFLK